MFIWFLVLLLIPLNLSQDFAIRLEKFELSARLCKQDPKVCGFEVLRKVIKTEQIVQVATSIATKTPIIVDNTYHFHSGSIRYQTVENENLTKLVQNQNLTLPNKEERDPPFLSEITISITSGPSNEKSDWFRREFMFDENELTKRSLSSDILPLTKQDIIIPLRNENDQIEICIGSQFVRGLPSSFCSTGLSNSQSFLKELCMNLAKNQCPKQNIFKPKLTLGDILLINENTLHRIVGVDSNPRKPRFDLHLTASYGWWWNNTLSIWNTTTAIGDVKEEDDICQVPMLWFGNRNIVGKDIGLYFGNFNKLATLYAGSNYSTPTIPGVYSLRIQGVARKIWKVESAFTSSYFFASMENLDVPLT